jgi:hypothetical protein
MTLLDVRTNDINVTEGLVDKFFHALYLSVLVHMCVKRNTYIP